VVLLGPVFRRIKSDHIGIDPEADLAVFGAGSQAGAVGAEGQAADTGEEFEIERAFDVAGGGVKDLQGAVVAGGEDVLAVGADGHAGDVIAGAPEGADVLAGLRIPQADVAVAAGGGDPFAVGAEGDGADVALVAGVGNRLVAVGQVPDLDG